MDLRPEESLIQFLYDRLGYGFHIMWFRQVLAHNKAVQSQIEKRIFYLVHLNRSDCEISQLYYDYMKTKL